MVLNYINLLSLSIIALDEDRYKILLIMDTEHITARIRSLAMGDLHLDHMISREVYVTAFGCSPLATILQGRAVWSDVEKIN